MAGPSPSIPFHTPQDTNVPYGYEVTIEVIISSLLPSYAHTPPCETYTEGGRNRKS